MRSRKSKIQKVFRSRKFKIQKVYKEDVNLRYKRGNQKPYI